MFRCTKKRKVLDRLTIEFHRLDDEYNMRVGAQYRVVNKNMIPKLLNARNTVLKAWWKIKSL